MKYTFDSRVRYSESDENGRLSLTEILNYFQDCSTFQSEATEHNIQNLMKIGRLWVLSGWQVIVDRYPCLGEKITISTWAYEFKGFIGYRNYTMHTESGECVAYANTIWSFISAETGLPARLTEKDIQQFSLEEKYNMKYAPRKIAVPKEMVVQPEIKIMKEHLDTNHHVNNVQYIDFAQRYLPEGFKIHQMRAEYKNQTRMGETLIPEIGKIENGYVVVLKKENVQAAVVEFAEEQEKSK